MHVTVYCTLYVFLSAMSNWRGHRATVGLKKVPERDFIALNKHSIDNGLTTAQEQAQYRATHDIRRREDSTTPKNTALTFSDDMTFGISTR